MLPLGTACSLGSRGHPENAPVWLNTPQQKQLLRGDYDFSAVKLQPKCIEFPESLEAIDEEPPTEPNASDFVPEGWAAEAAAEMADEEWWSETSRTRTSRGSSLSQWLVFGLRESQTRAPSAAARRAPDRPLKYWSSTPWRGTTWS